MKKQALTQEQYDDLVVELNHLQNVAIPNNSSAIKSAKEQGDLSENAEYDSAKELQGKLHSRLAEIKFILENHFIIQKNDNVDVIEIGHNVHIKRLNDNVTLDLQILGKWDNKATTTSIESPLGKALLGKRKGEKFLIEAPIGELEFEILDIH